MLQKIITLATILWVFIDWVKPAYEKLSFSRYITIGISVVCGMLQAFMFKLDLLVALGVVETSSIWGGIYAGLAISGGSALIYKIVDAFNNIKSRVDLEPKPEPEEEDDEDIDDEDDLEDVIPDKDIED